MAHPGFGKGGYPNWGRSPQPPEATGVWEQSPQPPRIFRVFAKKNSFLRSFLSKSGLNPPLLALFVDLRYSIGIFVCRLVVTENISGGALPFLPSPPGYARGLNIHIGK